jgi:acyl carrier protein
MWPSAAPAERLVMLARLRQPPRTQSMFSTARMSTVEALKALIHKNFDIDPASIDPQAPFESYNVDSLTLAELVFAVDDEYGIEIPDSAFTEIKTLAQFASVVDGLVANKGA